MCLFSFRSGHLFENSCTIGIPYIPFVMSICSLVVSNFGFEDGTLVLIASAPGQCLPFPFYGSQLLSLGHVMFVTCSPYTDLELFFHINWSFAI